MGIIYDKYKSEFMYRYAHIWKLDDAIIPLVRDFQGKAILWP